MPWTSLAWVVAGLGLIGVPLTAGFVSKWMLLMAFVEGQHWVLAGAMLVSSMLAVVYVWRVVEVLYFGEPSEKVLATKEAPLSMLIPVWVLVLLIVVFGCWTDFSAGVANQAADLLLGGSLR